MIVLKKIFKTFYYVLLGGLASIALLLAFSRFQIAGKWQTLMVLSGSMEPKIKTGSIVLVKGASTYKTGDVVTFKGEGKTPTTHRIVAETSEGFVTRGDANNADDLRKVQPQNILGKALLSIPYLGYLIAWARTTTGLIILIVIPAVIIIYSEALAIQKEIKKIIKARRKKQVPQTAAVSSEETMPEKKQAAPLPAQSTRIKVKEATKKTLKASILIFGFLSILNLRTIQGTKAFFADEEKSSATITAWVDTVAPDPDPALPEPGDVVINEFLPNPSGADDAAMPGGEWVELYNRGGTAVDVNNWCLYDNNDAHKLEITSGNTNTSNTLVAPSGFLVVYRNGDGDFILNNSGGDQVRLYDGTISGGANLIDSYTYTVSAPDDKSFARIPDGVDNWVDPIPTPGEPNILEEENNPPSAETEEETDDSAPIVDADIASDSTPANDTDIIETEDEETEEEEEEPAPPVLEPKEDQEEDAENPAITPDSASQPENSDEENNDPEPDIILPENPAEEITEPEISEEEPPEDETPAPPDDPASTVIPAQAGIQN